MNNVTKSIAKQLSMNDSGETGGHQAGMLIPKREEILSFFPKLDSSQKNPRAAMYFTDKSGKIWRMNFIYYNNRFFGGTRNEYRLTGMTAYFRESNLKAEDEVILTRSNNQLSIDYKKKNILTIREVITDGQKKSILVLGGGWKVIDYHKEGKNEN
jgi:hypothetical protein